MLFWLKYIPAVAFGDKKEEHSNTKSKIEEHQNSISENKPQEHNTKTEEHHTQGQKQEDKDEDKKSENAKSDEATDSTVQLAQLYEPTQAPSAGFGQFFLFISFAAMQYAVTMGVFGRRRTDVEELEKECYQQLPM